MAKQGLSESAQLARAARHLIQTHGARAAVIAMKRAAYLHQSGENLAALRWRQIAAVVREIEAEAARSPGELAAADLQHCEPCPAQPPAVRGRPAAPKR
jgi:hypothetical protein